VTDHLSQIRDVLKKEAAAIDQMAARLKATDVERAIELLAACVVRWCWQESENQDSLPERLLQLYRHGYACGVPASIDARRKLLSMPVVNGVNHCIGLLTLHNIVRSGH